MPRTKDEPAKKVGIWIRVSLDDPRARPDLESGGGERHSESPDHHRRRALQYAEFRGWSVVQVYDLGFFSGKTVWDHPENQRMLSDVRSGRISGLIFSKLERLARNLRELLDFAEIFQTAGADLISIEESIDTSTPAGRLFYTMLGAFAQFDRENIAARVAASVPIRAQLGKPLGGAAPFGYQWQDRKLEPHPQEAPIRRLMYELFLETNGRLRTVARLLNEAGHRTRNGSRFSDTTVARLIQDPTAKGLRRANYTRSRGEGKGWDAKPEHEWVFTPVPAIVSEDVWERCNQMLGSRRLPGAERKPTKRVVHLFAGLLFCGDCGTKMYVPSNGRKYTCASCHAKIAPDTLEMVFASELKNFVFSDEDVAQSLAQADANFAAKESRLAALRTEREQVGREMEKLYRLYQAEQISPEGFGSRNRPLEQRAQQLDNTIPELQAELDFLKIQMLSSEEIISETRDLFSRWEGMALEEKRTIVEAITDRIVLSGDEIELELQYVSAFAKDAIKGQQTFTGSWPRRA